METGTQKYIGSINQGITADIENIMAAFCNCKLFVSRKFKEVKPFFSNRSHTLLFSQCTHFMCARRSRSPTCHTRTVASSEPVSSSSESDWGATRRHVTAAVCPRKQAALGN